MSAAGRAPGAFLRPARRAAVRLLERLPPGGAWAVWRAVGAPASALRHRARGPEVALAAVAWGVDGYELGRLVERLAPAAGGPERLLVVSDCDAVHVASSRGCRFEHVPPRRDWDRHMLDRSYEAFLGERLDSVLDSYRVGRWLAVGDVPDAARRLLRGRVRVDEEPAPAPAERRGG